MAPQWVCLNCILLLESDPTWELLRGVSVGSKITIKGRVNRNPKWYEATSPANQAVPLRTCLLPFSCWCATAIASRRTWTLASTGKAMWTSLLGIPSCMVPGVWRSVRWLPSPLHPGLTLRYNNINKCLFYVAMENSALTNSIVTQMVIWCGTDAFHVTVNNGHQVDYTYRNDHACESERGRDVVRRQ